MPQYLLGVTWLAGPLAGVFLQPYVGACSDNSRSPWGRRRPYIVGGSLLIIAGIIILARAGEIASGFSCFLGLHGAEKTIAEILAMLSILFVNAGIQPAQVGLRALIVDTCPPQQQSQANAWAARITGAGGIFGFFMGMVDLPRFLPAIGDQFSALSFVTCIFLLITISITCWHVSEIPASRHEIKSSGAIRRYQEVFRSAKTLPKDIRDVCIVQFLSWLGWFPFLFYISE
jgi:solute carrier family 45, member 1/2/4